MNLELRVASKDLPLNQVKRKGMCLRYRRKRPEYLLPHAIEARTLVSTLSKVRCQKIISEEVQCKHDTIVPCGERIANLSYSEVLLALACKHFKRVESTQGFSLQFFILQISIMCRVCINDSSSRIDYLLHQLMANVFLDSHHVFL